MVVFQTSYLFENILNREQLLGELLKPLFPKLSPQAIQYELLQQGLLQKGRMDVTLNAWEIVERQLAQLKRDWNGPDVPVYILPITNGHLKNGVAYKEGICLFISTQLTSLELQALFVHEYHHICRLNHVNEPPTLMHSLIMEGLAEDAVENLFGVYALSSWTRNYSLNEIQKYWDSHIADALYQKGLQQHKPYLFGDDQLGLPPWIGYCAGYRIVQAFRRNKGAISLKELMQTRAEDIIEGAGFRRD